MTNGRRKKPATKANHERWMISYADMTTLCLAVFVVLWASAAQNTSRFSAEASSMFIAFVGHPPKLVQAPSTPHGIAHSLPDPVRRPMVGLAHPQDAAHRALLHQPKLVLSPSQQSSIQNELLAMAKLEKQLQKLLAPQIQANKIKVLATPLSLRIRLNASVLFPTGEATLTPSAVALLRPIGTMIMQLPTGYLITVEGYTDDQPIATAAFPSNWELSTARAVSVVDLFQSGGIPGAALSAEGFSQFRPIAPNDTEAGRSQNRRVEILVTVPQQGQVNPDAEK